MCVFQFHKSNMYFMWFTSIICDCYVEPIWMFLQRRLLSHIYLFPAFSFPVPSPPISSCIIYSNFETCRFVYVGYYGANGKGVACTPCAINRYCIATSNLACPALSTSAALSDSIDDCKCAIGELLH
jgi:hypothetical protein